MSRDDWFRNKKWDAATESHFNEKLRRARGKAQPLRIQAGYLVNADPKAALSLLDRYFALGDPFDLAQAFLDQAEAHLALGAQEEALRSLESALQRERELPNVKTQAWSRYALLIAESRLDHLYDKALQVLEEHRLLSYPFPVDVFRWHAAFALIAYAQGPPGPRRKKRRQSFGGCGPDRFRVPIPSRRRSRRTTLRRTQTRTESPYPRLIVKNSDSAH